MSRLRTHLVLIAVIVPAAVIGVQARPVVAQPQPADDPQRIRELAERMLARGSSGFAGYGPAVPPGASLPTARLLPGRLPDALPVALPMPQGSQIVGSVVRTAGGRPVSAEVLVEVPGSPGRSQALYEQTFAEQGWATPTGYPSGGFQQMRAPTPYYRCVGDDWTLAMMTFRQLDGGRVEVHLSLQFAPMAGISGALGSMAVASCSTVASPSGGVARGIPDYRRDLLPRLFAPAGSQLQTTGGAMGSDYATSEATAESDWSAGQLEAHFAAQLEQAGWEKVASGDAGVVAFSSWSLPHEPDWFGMLTIAQTPVENRYALTVRVETPSSGPGSVPSFSSRTHVRPVGPLVIPGPAPGASPGVLIPINPELTPQQMAECLSTRPDPAMCTAPPDPDR
jgi:hypothetical protein